MHRHTSGPGSYLLIAKSFILMSTKISPYCQCIYFVCRFIYKCVTPRGDHLRVRVMVRPHISRLMFSLSCSQVNSSHCTHHVIHWRRSLRDCQLWCAVEVVVSFRYPSLFLVSHLNIFSSLSSFPCMSQR